MTAGKCFSEKDVKLIAPCSGSISTFGAHDLALDFCSIMSQALQWHLWRNIWSVKSLHRCVRESSVVIASDDVITHSINLSLIVMVEQAQQIKMMRILLWSHSYRHLITATTGSVDASPSQLKALVRLVVLIAQAVKRANSTAFVVVLTINSIEAELKKDGKEK
jgi:hypothetical protein